MHLQASIVDLHFVHVAVFGFTFTDSIGQAAPVEQAAKLTGTVNANTVTAAVAVNTNFLIPLFEKKIF